MHSAIVVAVAAQAETIPSASERYEAARDAMKTRIQALIETLELQERQ